MHGGGVISSGCFARALKLPQSLAFSASEVSAIGFRAKNLFGKFATTRTCTSLRSSSYSSLARPTLVDLRTGSTCMVVGTLPRRATGRTSLNPLRRCHQDRRGGSIFGSRTSEFSGAKSELPGARRFQFCFARLVSWPRLGLFHLFVSQNSSGGGRFRALQRAFFGESLAVLE